MLYSIIFAVKVLVRVMVMVMVMVKMLLMVMVVTDKEFRRYLVDDGIHLRYVVRLMLKQILARDHGVPNRLYSM